MKKFGFIGCLIACGMFLLFGLTGCALFFEEEEEIIMNEVSTLEQLVAGGNIVLLNDIDCEYEKIKAIKGGIIDGKGFTIKNAVVHSTDFYDTAALFDCSAVKNLNIENVTVTADKSAAAAIVSVYGCAQIENVHVKNSSVKCGQITTSGMANSVKEAYAGGLYAGLNQFEMSDGALTKAYGCAITNCSVDNVTVELNGIEGQGSRNMADIYVGGIAAGNNYIENCFAKNCTLTANSTSCYSDAFVGGIVADTSGTIKNSYAIGCKINSNVPYYAEGAFQIYSTATAYSGGICAQSREKAEISYCYAENNTIKALSCGEVNVGGLIGKCDSKVSQSYTSGNSILGDGYLKGNKSDTPRYMAGLIGFSSKANLLSCFSYGNTVSENTVPDKNTSAFACGLIGKGKATMVRYCASAKNTLLSLTMDEFCAFNLDANSDCYVTNQTYQNKNGCSLVDESFWYTENTIKESLMLLGNLWVFENNVIPRLELS